MPQVSECHFPEWNFERKNRGRDWKESLIFSRVFHLLTDTLLLKNAELKSRHEQFGETIVVCGYYTCYIIAISQYIIVINLVQY